MGFAARSPHSSFRQMPTVSSPISKYLNTRFAALQAASCNHGQENRAAQLVEYWVSGVVLSVVARKMGGLRIQFILATG